MGRMKAMIKHLETANVETEQVGCMQMRRIGWGEMMLAWVFRRDVEFPVYVPYYQLEKWAHDLFIGTKQHEIKQEKVKVYI